MDSLFTSVLEISWQAGLIALAVMAVRPLLRRAPRRAVCMLWLLVALRLLLPARLTVESPVSLQQPESPPIQAYQELRQQEKVYVSAPPEQRLEMAGPAAAQGFALLDQLPAIWLTGVGCMALYMALSLLRMRWRLRAAPRIQDNVYRCTDWSTPFVLGVLAPRIYVPETVSEQDFPQVLAHERCHIRRWDHVWKPLAFLLLAVNWFNPVLWAAYVLLGRDMERACDEMVLKNATPIQRAAYSRALVACAAQPKMAAVCPLAFGEVAVKERVKNVLNYKKPALWAVILLVVAAAIIGACLLTKPSYKNVGTLDAEKLFALRTEYVGDNAAVSGILDALGLPEMGDTADSDTYAYSIRLDTNREPMGVTVCYAFAGDVPERSAEWNRQMAQRGYIAMALIDNIDWFRWTDIDQAGTSHVTGAVYSSNHAGYVDALSAARKSVKGLQTYMDMLRTMVEDGSIVYYEGDAQPSFEETMPWSVTGENDPCSVRAEDYGIVYDAAQLPDWETVPLSYLCAYYLNGDGAYAEGAMDVLAHRYQQAPNTVKAYLRRLAGQQVPDGRGDASEVLLADISRYAMSQLTGGLPVAASYERDQLSISVSEVYSVTYRTVTYDENYSEDIPVYEVGSGAQLSVIKGEGFTLYGRYNEENVALHNGDVVELTEQFVGLGMDGQYAVRFQYRSAAETAELEVYQNHVGDGRFRQAGRAADGGAGAGHPVGEGTGAAGVVSGVRHPAPQRRGRCPLLGHCRLPRAAHGAENTDGAVRLYLRHARGFPGQYDFRQAGVLRRRDVHRRQSRPARSAKDADQRQSLRRRNLLRVRRQADGDVRRRADGVGAEGDGQLRQLYVRLVELRHGVRQRESAVLADVRRAL